MEIKDKVPSDSVASLCLEDTDSKRMNVTCHAEEPALSWRRRIPSTQQETLRSKSIRSE